MAAPYISFLQVQWAAKAKIADERRVKSGGANPQDDVERVADALNSLGLLRSGHQRGFFDNPMNDGYKLWQERLYGKGPDADGYPGVDSLTKLGKKTGKFQVRDTEGTYHPQYIGDPDKPTATSTNATAANYESFPEPPQDMTRVYWGGQLVNKRTAILLNRAESILNHKYDLKLTQGSYNAGGVAASAGTHDGGGAADINVSPYTIAQQNEIVQALRKAGFAAWRRYPPAFAPHIHVEAIGDRDLSSGARAQVSDYFNGDAGLVGSARTEGALHWPNWADKYNR